MPKLKAQHDSKPYSLVGKRRMLQSVAAQMQVEAAEAEIQASSARQREQVLTDICRYMEQVLDLRAKCAPRGTNKRPHNARDAPNSRQQPAGQPETNTPPSGNQHKHLQQNMQQQILLSQNVQQQHQQQQQQQQQERLVQQLQEYSAQPHAMVSGHNSVSSSTQRLLSNTHTPTFSSAGVFAAGVQADLPAASISQLMLQHAPHLAALPPRIADVLYSMPPYCCMIGLLEATSKEFMAAVAGWTAQDWSSLFSAGVYELTLLLELTQRQQQQQVQEHEQQQRPGAAPAPGQQQQVQENAALAEQQPPPQRRCTGPATDSSSGQESPDSVMALEASFMSGGSWSTLKVQPDPLGQQPQQQPQAPASPPAAAAAPPVAAVGSLEQLVMHHIAGCLTALGCLAGAVCPDALFVATACNHRIPLAVREQQQQQQEQQEQPPWSHWQAVVQRLDLSPAQTAYLRACATEVVPIIKAEHEALQRLTPLAGGHSLLFMAAEPPPVQQEQQLLDQQQQQEWTLLLQHSRRSIAGDDAASAGSQQPSTVQVAQPHTQAVPHAHAGPASHQEKKQGQGKPPVLLGGSSLAAEGCGAAADAASAVVTAMSSHASQAALWGALLLHLIMDCLTAEQKAKLLVACYPWMPLSMPLCLSAAQLAPPAPTTQRQPSQPQTPQQTQTARLDQQRQQHHQQHRQQWWLSLMQELHLNDSEAAAAASAAGVARQHQHQAGANADGVAAAAAAATEVGGADVAAGGQEDGTDSDAME